jgi:hypothetical protein
MKGALYVVETFCAFAIYRAVVGILAAGDATVLLAGQLLSLLLTLVLTALSLLGRPLARRLLAALIVGNTVYLGYRYPMTDAIPAPLLAIVILFAIYLCVGAVKLWRMAEVQSQGGSHA